MAIERFEDLIAWQKARALTAKIYSATRSGSFAKDFGLIDQIRRAAVSIGSNIAEGFERGNNIDTLSPQVLHVRHACPPTITSKLEP